MADLAEEVARFYPIGFLPSHIISIVSSSSLSCPSSVVNFSPSPAFLTIGNNEDVNNYIKVEVENPELCPRYTARVVKNIKLAPSPEWMQRRLASVGIRPINNIVDITNYVMDHWVEINSTTYNFTCTKFFNQLADKIPVTLPKSSATAGGVTEKLRFEKIARAAAEGYGFSEGMTYSFESPKVYDKLCLAEDDALRKSIPYILPFH